MWGLRGNRVNTQNQSNKAKAGSIKNSTIEVTGSNDATTAIILQAVLDMKKEFTKTAKKFNKRIDVVEAKQQRYMIGFNHYVKNNGVAPHVKKEVTEMLDLHKEEVN